MKKGCLESSTTKLSLCSADKERLFKEPRMLATVLGRPHCVQFVNAWSEEGFVYIQVQIARLSRAKPQMQCGKRSLAEIMDSYANSPHWLTDDQIWDYCTDIVLVIYCTCWSSNSAKGLHEIHSVGILHLDIKPANIIEDEQGLLMIGDFGQARPNVQSSNTDIFDSDDDVEGDGAYLAPEFATGPPSYTWDIFSLG